jgi:hypothetical protein
LFLQGIGNAVMGGLGCGIGGLVGGALLGMNLGQGWAPVWGLSAAVVAGIWVVSFVGPLAWSRLAYQGAAGSGGSPGKSISSYPPPEDVTQLVASPTQTALRGSVDATVTVREVGAHTEGKDA